MMGRFSPGDQRAWFHASCAASRRNFAARSALFTWRLLKRVFGISVGKSTSAAFFARWRETSKSVTGRNAVWPRRKPSEFFFQPAPNAVMIPVPVMATRTRSLFFACGGNCTNASMRETSSRSKRKNLSASFG